MKDILYYAEIMGIKLTNSQHEAFNNYRSLLVDWNTRINLTSITDPEEIALKHFADSLAVMPYIEEVFNKATDIHTKQISLIDIGTGAGFPGIPLKIALPNLDVTLLDSLNKRISFLDAVISQASLAGIKAVHSRAEEGARNPVFREKFDIAIARAVANMTVLCEYCLPFVKIGGIFIAMKASADDELEQAKSAIQLLGGKIESNNHFLLPDSDINRSVIVIRKIAKTPVAYPRKAGKPEKEPLLSRQ